jgi:DNA-binding transcriptional ArsR family regulator
MKINKEIKRVLGLGKEELLLLEAIGDTTQRTSDVAKKVDIPRTTTERLLKKLSERGLVKKHKYSARRGGWRGVSVDEVIESMRGDDTTSKSEAYPVKHIVGLPAMRAFEYDLIERLKNKKYCGIQGPRAWRAFHTTFGEDEAHRINEMLVTENVLADIIISEKTDKELLKRAYFDRPSLVHSIPDKFLSTAFDIEITAKEVAIMNWESKRTLSIVDDEVAKLFLGIFAYMKECSEYFNVYKEVEGLGMKVMSKE